MPSYQGIRLDDGQRLPPFKKPREQHDEAGLQCRDTKAALRGARSPDWENADYDVAPNGRFLMVMRSGEEPKAAEFNVILNWFEDLKIRVPPR